MLTVRRTSTTVECVELDELKTFLRIDYVQFDSVLNTCIIAAREWVENYTSTFWAKGVAAVKVSSLSGSTFNTYWAGLETVIDDDETEATITQNAADYSYLNFVASIDTEYNLTVGIGTETPPQTVRLAIMALAGQIFASQTGEMGSTQAIKTMLMPFRKYLYL